LSYPVNHILPVYACKPFFLHFLGKNFNFLHSENSISPLTISAASGKLKKRDAEEKKREMAEAHF